MLKKMLILLVCLLLPLCFVHYTFAADQSIEGLWKTIDDKTGKKKSIVQIYKQNEKYFGKIIKLFREPDEDQNPICDKCASDDPRKDQPIKGMIILKNLEKIGNKFKNGTILDPHNGKVYDCKLWIEDGKLKLRGYILFLYRTQTWLPANPTEE